MAVVSFWSDEEKETGQTLSMVALSTYMAIEHNYRILNVSTNFKDNTLENCYWNLLKERELTQKITANQAAAGIGAGLESGIEGLVKIIKSNKTSSNIVSNYSRVVFNNRLDVLCCPKTKTYSEYLQIAQIYPDILSVANRNYDLVFVDISKKMDEREKNKILEISDVIIVNITQRLEMLDRFLTLKEENSFFKNNNILLNIGRSDSFSKYNVKNVSRYLRMKKDVLEIPYNTLFFESCSDGKVAEFFLKMRNLDEEDRNGHFIKEVDRMTKEVIYKLQELQIRM